MKTIALLLLVASTATATTYFKDTFDSDPFSNGWTHSEWKSKSERGSFSWTAGEWSVDEEADKGLMTSEDARFHAISNKLAKSIPAFTLGKSGKDLVVQFTARNHLREYAFCGGGYIKLLPKMDAKNSVVIPHTVLCLALTCVVTMYPESMLFSQIVKVKIC